MSGLKRDRMSEPVSRDHILSRERVRPSRTAYHEQGWQPYPADTCSAESAGHIYIHTIFKPKRRIIYSSFLWQLTLYESNGPSLLVNGINLLQRREQLSLKDFQYLSPGG